MKARNVSRRRLFKSATILWLLMTVLSCSFFLSEREVYASEPVEDENGFVICDGELIAYAGYESEIVIPDTVTAIGDYALYNNSWLTSVTIPDSVTSIGEYAFGGCYGLTDLTMSDNVTTIGDYAFSYCYELTEITIPSKTSSIGEEAFSYCLGLTDVTISDNVSSLGKKAFYSCCGLTDITIPKNVKTVGSYAFADCTGLETVTVSEGVTTLGDYVFSGCTGLTTITIPESVTKLGDYAFYSCAGLTEITLSKELTAIGKYVFYDCTGLTEIVIPEGVTSIGYSAFRYCANLTDVTIPSSMKTIGDYAFSGCSGLEEVSIPDKVTTIGNYGFYGCTSLTDVTIPESVTTIGVAAFDNCKKLESIVIPSKVTAIKYGTFYGCVGLKEIAIPAGVTSIGERAFYDCSGLTAITIPENVTSIGDRAFYGCSGLTAVTVPASVTSIGSNTFTGIPAEAVFTVERGSYADEFVTNLGFQCEYLSYIVIQDGVLVEYVSDETEIVIPDGVTALGYEVFSGRTDITSVTIPEGVTSIGSSAFYGCTGLTEVVLPESLTSIGSYAFCDCESLEEIVIPDGVTSIGYYAFEYCDSLKKVVLSRSVDSYYSSYILYGLNLDELTIPDNDTGTFGLSSVKKVIVRNTVTNMQTYWFEGTEAFEAEEGGVYSTEDGVLFKTVDGVKTLVRYPRGKEASAYSIPEDVDAIGAYAFYYCAGVENVEIPDSLTAIGDYAFYYCTGLTEIEIPDGVTDIGAYTFRYCDSLKKVVLSRSIDSSSSYILSGLNLDELTIPDNRTGTFGLNSVKKVIIRNTVTNMQTQWFEDTEAFEAEEGGLYSTEDGVLFKTVDGVKSLIRYPQGKEGTSYTIPSDVSAIGASAFYYCSNLAEVEIPEGVTSIGDSAFYYFTGLKEITIPEGVTSIGSSAFYYCTGLTKVSIPGSVTSIGSSAFSNCTGLTSITIPEGVTSIGSSAFYNCTGLVEAILSDSVTTIGSSLFLYCSNLKKVVLGRNTDYYLGNRFVVTAYPLYNLELDELTVPDNDTRTHGLKSVKKIIVRNTVTNLQTQWFEDTEAFEAEEGGLFSTEDGVLFKTEDGVKTLVRYPRGKEGTSYTIPSDVSVIGANAFYYCTNLTEVVIPEGITSIGNNAFYYCSGLTGITIPESVTSIGSSAFCCCTGLTGIVIPESVTSIGSSAFSGCTGLTEVVFREGVTTIDSYAFASCTGLTELTIPDSVTSIGNYAFNNCDNIKKVVLGQNVSSASFLSGLKLDELTIPDKNTSTFGLSSVKKIIVRNTVTKMQIQWFEDTEAFEAEDGGLFSAEDGVLFKTEDGVKTLVRYPRGKEGTTYTIPSDVSVIGAEAFRDCTNLAEVVIPEGVTSIGNYAFYYCTGLTGIAIPESVTSIGNSAFYYCTGMTELTIPGNVTSIGSYAFQSCTGLTGVVFREGVTSIGSYAFYNCTGLTELTIPDSVTSIGNYAFDNCDNIKKVVLGQKVTSASFLSGLKLDELTIPDNSTSTFGLSSVKKIIVRNTVTKMQVQWFEDTEAFEAEAGGLFSTEDGVLFKTEDGVKTLVRYPRGKEGTSYTIPSDVSVIGASAFYYCSNLTEVVIPEGVTSIGNSVFYYCTSLSEITIPGSVTDIGSYAFQYCTGVTEVILENGVTTIGESAFNNCTGLTTVEIPDSVETIGYYAFRYCSNLKKVILGSNVTSTSFLTSLKLDELTIPDNSTSTFGLSSVKKVIIRNTVAEMSSGWFAETEAFEAEEGGLYSTEDGVLFKTVDGVKTLVRYPQGKEGTSYTIPSDVSVIGANAFYYCSNLTEVVIPEGVTSIGNSAFYYCTGLSEITIPESVTNIGNYTFQYCTGITEVILENGVTTIGESAFNNCIGLTTVEIPDSVETIGYYAFRYCSNLKKVILGSNVTSTSFLTSLKLDELTIPDNSTSTFGLSSVKKVIIRNTVTEMSSGWFADTEAFEAEEGGIYSTEDGVLFKTVDGVKTLVCYPRGKEGTSYTIPADVSVIGESAFYNCSNLTEVVIPEGVTTIGNSAFYNCTGLTRIAIPETVASIGTYAFQSCTGLSEVVFQNGVTTIGNGAFYSCTGLTELSLPDSVTTIATDVFRYCSNLKSIKVGSGVTQLGSSIFYSCSSELVIYCYADTMIQQYAINYSLNYSLLEEHEHSYGEWVVLSELSCTRKGEKYRKCESCYEYEFEEEEALGHDLSDWKVDKEATALEEGKEIKECSRCEYTEERAIPCPEVDWDNTTEYSKVTIKLIDNLGMPLAGGKLIFEAEDGTTYEAVPDENGMISRILFCGTYTVKAYYNNAYVRTIRREATAGVCVWPDLCLLNTEALSGTLTAKEMNLEEIKAAGIDTSAAGNQQIVKWEIKIGFSETMTEITLPFFGYKNNNTSGSGGGAGGGGSAGGGGGGTGGGGWSFFSPKDLPQPGKGKLSFSDGRFKYEDQETVLYIEPINEKLFIVIRGETKWLKEMYDVELFLVNNSFEDMVDCKAELFLPSGLSLAEMLSGYENKAVEEIGRIESGETKSIHWYVRGDEAGEYDLSATVTGKMEDYGDEFSYDFVTESKLKVYAGDALHMTIYCQKKAQYQESFKVGIEVKNVSDKTLYNLTHRVISVEQQVCTTYKYSEKAGSYTVKSWTEEDWRTICQTEIDESGCIFVEELEPGESVVVWVETTIAMESWLKRQAAKEYKKSMEMIDLIVGSTAKHTADLMKNMLTKSFESMQFSFFVDCLNVTTEPGSTTSIPYSVEYIGDTDLSLKVTYDYEFQKQLQWAFAGDIADTIVGGVIDKAIGASMVLTAASKIKGVVDDVTYIVDVNNTVNECRNIAVEVTPPSVTSNVKVWTESRTRSIFNNFTYSVTPASEETSVVQQEDGSYIISGGMASIVPEADVPGEYYIFVQEVDEDGNLCGEGKSAIVVYAQDRPDAELDEQSGTLYYKTAVSLSEEFVETLADMNMQFVDGMGREMSAGSYVGTGCKLVDLDSNTVYPVVVKGDLSGDGVIGTSDLSYVASVILGETTPNDTAQDAMSVTGNTEVDIFTLKKLAQMMAAN